MSPYDTHLCLQVRRKAEKDLSQDQKGSGGHEKESGEKKLDKDIHILYS